MRAKTRLVAGLILGVVSQLHAAPTVTSGLYRFDLATGRVTSLGSGCNPVWRPDGRQIVFLDIVGAGDYERGHVVLMTVAPDGTGRRRLDASAAPGELLCAAFSSDGRYLALLSYDPRRSPGRPPWPIYLTILSGSGGLSLGPLPLGTWLGVGYYTGYERMAWCPGSHRLAVTPDGPDMHVPFLVDVPSGRRVKLTDLERARRRAAIPDDYEARFFNATAEVDPNGPLVPAWRPTWTGDGRYLCFPAKERLWWVRADQPAEVSMTSLPVADAATVPGSPGCFVVGGNPTLGDVEPRWLRQISPDGAMDRAWDLPERCFIHHVAASKTHAAWLGHVFAPSVGDEDPPGVAGVWLAGLGGKVVRIAEVCRERDGYDGGWFMIECSEAPSWSPDGRQLVFGIGGAYC